MEIRAEKQLKLAKKQGKRSAEIFIEGDSVRIQNIATGKWDKSGTIKEARVADDGQEVSFLISLPNGKETIRHRNHLRHNLNRYTKISETRVKFNMRIDTDGEERNKSDKHDVVKPLKLRKAKSAGNNDTWEISSNNNNDEGIATRTRSKIDMSKIPLKSVLKKRPLES